jgi:hypothetical protein
LRQQRLDLAPQLLIACTRVAQKYCALTDVTP